MRRRWILVLLATWGCAARSRSSQPPRDLDVLGDAHPAPAAPVATDSAPPARVVAPAPPATAPVAPTPTPPPAKPDPATLATLGWPASTASFVVKTSAHVFEKPDMTAEPLGKIISSTRLPVGASVAGDRRCKTFLAVPPRGYICARYAKPSTLPPEAIAQPIVPPGRLLPQDYYGIKKGAKRYASVEDVQAGIAKPEPRANANYMVTRDEEKGKPKEPVTIDGVSYIYTSVGLVAAEDLFRHKPSTFAGVDLIATPPPAWPFGWVIAPNSKTATARATPAKKGEPAGTFTHRQIVPILEESAGYVRVGDGQWIERKSVRIARKRSRPVATDADAKWIDIDRDEQVMIAYDGDTPVFATLVSSGRRKNDTPPALYRIRSKSSLTKMAAEESEASHYIVSEVPWATRFRSGLYFHAAYWHDRFGTVQSHGCVNLSPTDAKWVYDWTDPTMPPGWNELEVRVPGSMMVRVFDAAHPDPKEFDYEKEAIQRAKIRKQEELLKKAREAVEAVGETVQRSGVKLPPRQ
ncbi:MAG TPA: L,D-transpeptidase [Kofleriaceae bacterium]|nr:L,D-transpeptidase [Kofleriaceae bacterium]